MQSRFIQIKYCSNILIIPELLFVGVSGVSAVLLGGSARRFFSAVLLAAFYDLQTNVVLFVLFCWMCESRCCSRCFSERFYL